MDLDRLFAAARAAAANAYAPYSRFAVGAALLLDDGAIVTGANFENASYGLSLCAETVALAKANSEGKLGNVIAVAVTGGAMRGDEITGGEPVRPCGRCRQVLNETGRDLDIVCFSADGAAVERHKLSALLPNAFGPRDLG